MASARLTVSVPPPLPAVEKEEVEMKQWRWHDGRGRRFPGGCGDGDWLEQLSRPLLEDDVEEEDDKYYEKVMEMEVSHLI